MRGEYIIINPKTGLQEGPPIKNTLIQEGHEKLMDCLFNEDTFTGWAFVFGAFAEVPAYTQTQLAQYLSEPTLTVNGYVRVELPASGFTIAAQNNEVYAESPDIAFTATGAGSFDKAFNRFFMHLKAEKPAATFTEYLASISSALPQAKTVAALETYLIRYRVYLK